MWFVSLLTDLSEAFVSTVVFLVRRPGECVFSLHEGRKKKLDNTAEARKNCWCQEMKQQKVLSLSQKVN